MGDVTHMAAGKACKKAVEVRKTRPKIDVSYTPLRDENI